MKTFCIIFSLLFLIYHGASAQLSVTLVPSNHYGSNITCNGLSDGALSAVPTGGTEPYTYEWSNSATTSSLEGLSAGRYTVTVTDAESNVATASIEMLEPRVLELHLYPSEY